jgi:hypothetical protein
MVENEALRRGDLTCEHHSFDGIGPSEPEVMGQLSSYGLD